MLQTGRQRHILDLIRQRGECSVEDLVRACGVSDMTIRRDLQKLADEGRVVRTHGGAAPANQVSFEFQFLRRTQEHAAAKEQIGAAAAGLVRDGQSVLLDSGTTTLAIARHLIGRRRLTVITTSLPVASVLQQAAGVETLLLGGYVRKESPDLQGPLTEANLEQLRADVAFVGADGVDERGNVYNGSLGIARMLTKAAAAAKAVYVVADHSKLGRTALASFGRAAEWDGLVTDSSAGGAAVRKLRAAGVNVIMAGKSNKARHAREMVHG